ncbi:hypothetical protein FM117_05175 [Micrococcus luteus Mu201]|nr:hypothetical protein FM117_05175 [Micrococcus luteus Mu201]
MSPVSPISASHRGHATSQTPPALAAAVAQASMAGRTPSRAARSGEAPTRRCEVTAGSSRLRRVVRQTTCAPSRAKPASTASRGTWTLRRIAASHGGGSGTTSTTTPARRSDWTSSPSWAGDPPITPVRDELSGVRNGTRRSASAARSGAEERSRTTTRSTSGQLSSPAAARAAKGEVLGTTAVGATPSGSTPRAGRPARAVTWGFVEVAAEPESGPVSDVRIMGQASLAGNAEISYTVPSMRQRSSFSTPT